MRGSTVLHNYFAFIQLNCPSWLQALRYMISSFLFLHNMLLPLLRVVKVTLVVVVVTLGAELLPPLRCRTRACSSIGRRSQGTWIHRHTNTHQLKTYSHRLKSELDVHYNGTVANEVCYHGDKEQRNFAFSHSLRVSGSLRSVHTEPMLPGNCSFNELFNNFN